MRKERRARTLLLYLAHFSRTRSARNNIMAAHMMHLHSVSARRRWNRGATAQQKTIGLRPRTFYRYLPATQVTTPRLLFHTIWYYFVGVGKTRRFDPQRLMWRVRTLFGSIDMEQKVARTPTLPVCVLNYMMNARSRILEVCVLTKMIVSACTIDPRQKIMFIRRSRTLVTYVSTTWLESSA